MGITAGGISEPLQQSTKETQFFDIGTAEPYAINGDAIKQRSSLVNVIKQKAKEADYATAYKYIIEGVAYTWFNRLIAVRFMEVNDYLPSHIRVLSSESGKMEPDLVTTPFDADLPFTDIEKQEVIKLKNDNELDECFRLLFIKQCNVLNEILPALFERTSDYTELLLNVSAIDKEGVVYHLINDIPEEDFNIEKGGQVEIIGWMYQYYNTEPKNEAFAKTGKITKEEIPAVTQLFTPDWIVRYMVENSLGRIWVEGHPNESLKAGWKYYLDEAEQDFEVQVKLNEIHTEYAELSPEDIHFIDPCMGSGHILVYAFDVFMQIYQSAGYSERDAARSILENNLFGLDIDDRAYQMAYFAVMMKARQYNRRILSAETPCHVYSIHDSNRIDRNKLSYFGTALSYIEKNDAVNQISGLLDTFKDAKEYGSILDVENYNWNLLKRFAESYSVDGQMSLDMVGIDETQKSLQEIIAIGETMARKYEVVSTNPPYMGGGNMPTKLSAYVKKKYETTKRDLYTVFIARCMGMLKEKALCSMITQQGWMFINSYEALRDEIVEEKQIISMAHLGPRAFEEIGGEVVQTTTFVIRADNDNRYSGKFVRLTDADSEEGKKNLFLVKKRDNDFFEVKQSDFKMISKTPIAYWLAHNTRLDFKNSLNIESSYFSCYGLLTGHDEGYIFEWFEVSDSDIKFDANNLAEFNGSKKKYAPLCKGGVFRKWYGNRELVVRYDEEGIRGMSHYPKYASNGQERYFSEGITWAEVCMGNLSVRYMPSGNVFSLKGPCMFADDKQSLMRVIGYLNTNVVHYFVQILNPTISCGTGVLNRLPIKGIECIDENVVKENISISKEDWDSFETSWDFKKHPLV